MKDCTRILFVKDTKKNIELPLKTYSQHKLFNQVDVCKNALKIVDIFGVQLNQVPQ